MNKLVELHRVKVEEMKVGTLQNDLILETRFKIIDGENAGEVIHHKETMDSGFKFYQAIKLLRNLSMNQKLQFETVNQFTDMIHELYNFIHKNQLEYILEVKQHLIRGKEVYQYEILDVIEQ